MTDDETLTEYFEKRSRDIEKSIPPLKIFNETRYLSAEMGKLLISIFDSGYVTVEELASETDLAKPKIKRNLGELRKQGYIGVDYDSGVKYYYVRSEWGTQDFPSGPIIPLVYQFNLLSDRSRMEALHEAIDKTVEEGDTVADLGAGVGALSYMASKKAEQVYAVEVDREIHEKGQEIMQQENITNVEYIRGDAREVELPEEVDVVLCEMLDTALIAELQVPVMNHAFEELCASSAKAVPAKAKTTMCLIDADYEFYGGEFRIPHFEEYGSRESHTRSNEVTYHDVNFAEQNSDLVQETVRLEATETGLVNGIQLNTDVRFAEGMDLTGASPWLNPPLNLPLDEDLELTKGDELSVEISYELGGGLSNIVYEIINE